MLSASRTHSNLIGDPYLARIHSAAADRLHLREWARIISDKLDIIGTFYHVLSDRVDRAQSQTLELVVIALIIVEIVIAIFSRV